MGFVWLKCGNVFVGKSGLKEHRGRKQGRLRDFGRPVDEQV